MSISNTTYVATATGDGSTVAFSFPFYVFTASDLIVYLIDKTVTPNVSHLQTITTNYSVAINASSEGGSITFVAAPTLNWEVYIERIRLFTQPLVLVTEGAL